MIEALVARLHVDRRQRVQELLVELTLSGFWDEVREYYSDQHMQLALMVDMTSESSRLQHIFEVQSYQAIVRFAVEIATIAEESDESETPMKGTQL